MREDVKEVWPRHLNVTIRSFSSHHIEVVVEEDDQNLWRFVGFYGHHEVRFQRHSSELLKFINNNSDLPTSFLGDFNKVLDVGEHSSCRRVRPWWKINNFKRVVAHCELIDIGFSGYPFTWCNNFFSPYTTRARLDRCLVGKNWKVLFPEASISHLTSTHSDHLALLLKCGKKQDLGIKKWRFRFEDGWCLYKESKEMVEKWKRNCLGNVQKSLKEKHHQFDALQQGLITNDSNKESMGLAKQIDRLRETNDIYWQQRSRVEWRVKGDRNTGYFHAVAV
ncbi:hypothetical protein LIER_27239 [Lithospermum erythrorhizon]|uniref:Uncharacterized protein n=1 Tax=Lithospermum erythrorhizon TaxID=34254 RepID=A0AAV3RFE0_LITER